MHLSYAHDRSSFVLWGEPRPGEPLERLWQLGSEAEVALVVPDGRLEQRRARVIPLVDAIAELAMLERDEERRIPRSCAVWSLSAKLALELVVKQRIVMHLVPFAGAYRAKMAVSLSAAEDRARFEQLSQAFPPAAHALPVPAQDGEPATSRGKRRDLAVWTPPTVLRHFLDDTADALTRGRTLPPEPHAPSVPRQSLAAQPWERRLHRALLSEDAWFDVSGFAERSLVEALAKWAEPALLTHKRPRLCLRMEIPERKIENGREAQQAPFLLRFLLQDPDDPSSFYAAEDVWQARGKTLYSSAELAEELLRSLALAARLFEPLEHALRTAHPESLALDPASAWKFLSEAAPRLSEVGFGVIVPTELTASGARRLRLRLRVGSGTGTPGVVSGASGLSLEGMLDFRFEAAIGNEALSVRELLALAQQKAPLVRFRGRWVAVDPKELIEIRKRVERGAGTIQVSEAISAALSGTTLVDALPAAVVADGDFKALLDRLQVAPQREIEPPASFQGQLRPYQRRGLAWLESMSALGLGACLADDMGLGKTIQLLAFLLALREEQPKEKGAHLLVAPTSVVGNWEREAARFAPLLRIRRQYGPGRASTIQELSRRGELCITTYGTLRRDAPLLSEVHWASVVLDESQNIKNAASATARAARALRASRRFALSGTPIENRLAELWSVLEFLNPGLLGKLETFRRKYAIPIERYGDPETASRLKRIVAPFVLRRKKSDPTIIADLPAKNEMKVICTLTREQATLYRAAVDEALRRIKSSEGIERRGLVLALLTGLKQICNHPAQYLGEKGPLPGRSGKLERLREMLDEALTAGDKVLIFTQYREMGQRLVAHLEQALAEQILFLHGGVPRARRDEMVRKFQEHEAPRLFVLSVKAGGTGLNLTAANHVFHFDRWWNPAVEDQATDRAYRIGQTKNVQVHKLMSAGTVEETIDGLLETKRDLADRIVGAGESWITELGDDELEELFSLKSDAVIGGDDEQPEEAS